jgi:hypothetical protein
MSMLENYPYPHGRLARFVEKIAAKKFGPEELSKDIVAQALHIPVEQLSENEWIEISEFAVNAGSQLIRSSVDKNIPISTRDEYEAVRADVKEFARGLIPFHDIFHAAETYRLTQGKSATAEFARVGIRERYTDPISAAAELYPVLFLIIPPNLDEPFPVLLSHSEGREAIADFLASSFDTDLAQVREMVETLKNTSQPVDLAGRKKEYEMLVEVIVIHNAMRKLEEVASDQSILSQAEVVAIHNAMQHAASDTSSYYYQFAVKIFSEKGIHPRVFLDEFLSCIRTKLTDISLENNPTRE